MIKVTRIFVLFWVGLIELLVSSNSYAWVNPWPEMPIPPDLKAEWIAEEIQHNGFDMKIIRIFGPVAAEDTLAFYVEKFSSNSNQSKIFGNEQQLVVSTLVRNLFGEFQFTLELRADTTTNGILSLTRLDSAQNHPAQKLDPLLPPGAKILSDSLSIDAHVLNRTLVAQHSHSVMHNEFRFKQLLARQGWLLEPTAEAPIITTPQQPKSSTLRFFKHKDELLLNLSADQGTAIVAVYLRKP